MSVHRSNLLLLNPNSNVLQVLPLFCYKVSNSELSFRAQKNGKVFYWKREAQSFMGWVIKSAKKLFGDFVL